MRNYKAKGLWERISSTVTINDVPNIINRCKEAKISNHFSDFQVIAAIGRMLK